MNREKAVVILRLKDKCVDIEVPLNISANDLVVALNEAYMFGIDTMNVKDCYMKAENPFALLKGNRLLSEFGVRNGTIINFTE